MSQTSSSAEYSSKNASYSGSHATALLSKLIYRSRAVRPLSPPQLHELALAAQSRNRNEAVTGLVLYDDSRFFQWLEGPAESLERIMRSISCDPRHTEIEVLHHQPAEARIFGDWNMKLAAQRASAVAWQHDVIEPPREIIADLRQDPDAAPALLVKLLPLASSAVASGSSPDMALSRHTAAILKSVILAAVLPEIAGKRAQSGPQLRVNPRARELADLLIAADPREAIELIRELRAEQGSIPPLYATLMEPVARTLGDLWSEDNCSEFDVTLGLCRMQSAIRLLRADAPAQAPSPAFVPAVLIAPEPGELHLLGASLDTDVLWDAGWAPTAAYPANDKALQDLLAARWFDVLDISLSAAFRRDHWLPRLTQTIAQARRASRNPALAVIVGGRMFVEERDAGLRVGADMASITALQVNQVILAGMKGTGQAAGATSGLTKSKDLTSRLGQPRNGTTAAKDRSWPPSATSPQPVSRHLPKRRHPRH